jgi:hypothetical protein
MDKELPHFQIYGQDKISIISIKNNNNLSLTHDVSSTLIVLLIFHTHFK